MSPLIPAVLVKKHRRSLVDVKLESGAVLTAYCPTRSILNGCTDPGSSVMLSDSGDPTRRNPFTWELVRVKTAWVCVNADVPAKVMYEAVEAGNLPGFTDINEIQLDALYGKGSRIDLVLHGMEQNCFINVYSVTWEVNGDALFPDAPNPRTTTSIRELTEIAEQGHRAVAFFFVQRGDCRIFKPAETADKDFLNAMIAAEAGGVEMLVHDALITMDGVTLGDRLPYTLR